MSLFKLQTLIIYFQSIFLLLELALHVQEKGLWELIDPYEVNFYNNPKETQDFIKFIESKGKFKPNFLKRKSKSSNENEESFEPVNESVVHNENLEQKFCEQCHVIGFQTFLDLGEDGLLKCEMCRTGTSNPFDVLKHFYNTHKVIPTKFDMAVLQKQTNLDEDTIMDYIQGMVTCPIVIKEELDQEPIEFDEDDAIPDIEPNDIKISKVVSIKKVIMDDHDYVKIIKQEPKDDQDSVSIKQEPMDDYDDVSIKQEPIDDDDDLDEPSSYVSHDITIKDELESMD